MEIEFDESKRQLTLTQRKLDFLDIGKIFAGQTLTYPDERKDYGEDRWITVGFLMGRMMIVVWTKRQERCRVVSLRKANDREKEKFGRRMGGSG